MIRILAYRLTGTTILGACAIFALTGCSQSDAPEPGGDISIVVSLTANPTTVDAGAASTLTWSATNATQCVGGGFDTSSATSGTANVAPSTTTDYSLTCSGTAADASANVTVTVRDAAATYYIANAPAGDNANDGSAASPWRDIQFGIDQADAGETVIVNPGTYSEFVLFSGADDSGTDTDEIRLIGMDGALIDGSALTPAGRQGLVTIRDASHIVIENFEIANFRTAPGNLIDDTPVGLLVEGASDNLTIRDLHIHHIENLSACGQSTGCGPGANGVAIYGNTATAISDLWLSGIEVSDCILAASEAFTLNGNVDGFRVTDNFVHDNNNIGFDFIGYEDDVCPPCSDEQNRVRNGIVERNRAINNSTNLAVGGFSSNPWYEGDDGSAGGFYVDGGRNILFDGNRSAQNDLGFEFASEHPNKSSQDILMINNYVYLNREAGLVLGGYSASSQGPGGGSARNIDVFNNSFFMNKGWGTEIEFSFRIINANFVNNILFGTGVVGENHAAQTNGQYQNIQWNNNIWWAPDISDTSGVQGVAVIMDPVFVDPDSGNLDLQSTSPAIDVGMQQSDLTTWTDPFWSSVFTNGIIPAHGAQDINGENRFDGMLDIGADEFQK